MTEILNLYKAIPKSFLPDRPTYQNYNKVRLDLPMRMSIIGASGSKKTQLCINLLRIMSGAWNRIYLFAKDLEEPLYKWLIAWFEKLQKKMKLEEPILLYSNDLKDLPPVDELDKTKSNLVILDDMITEKNLLPVTEYFIRGRKKNCSLIFITQSYYQMPKTLRGNCDVMCILKVNTARDLGRICSEYSLGTDKKDLEELYRYCVNSQNQNNFFMIDIGNQDPSLRFRCGFKPIELRS